MAACVGRVLTLNGYFVYVLANIALLALVGYRAQRTAVGPLTAQVSFGHVGSTQSGAYTVAVLTTKAGFGFWATWPLAALLAAAMGVLLALPALRVKGPYLAMVTIAFGFIVEQGIVEMRTLTGGQNGLMGIAAPCFRAAWRTLQSHCWCAAAEWRWRALPRCLAGTWGALRAVRDAETAAESLGLNALVLKTVAFTLSAVRWCRPAPAARRSHGDAAPLAFRPVDPGS